MPSEDAPISIVTRESSSGHLPRSYELAALTYTKFEGDVIEEFVRHTLRFVDRLYIVDNMTLDATREILEQLQAEGLPLTVWQSDVHESRMDVMTPLVRRVFAQDAADYLLLLDADEFVRCPSRAALESALSQLPPGAHATLPWVTYVPTPDDPKADNLLDRICYRQRTEALQFSKIVVSRSFAAQPSAEISAGFHSIDDPSGTATIQPLTDVEIAHFPVRSVAQLQGKALLGWSSFLIMGGEHADETSEHVLGYQWRRLYLELQKNWHWSHDDLCHYARTYLDIENTADLVYDPVPSVRLAYPHPIPDIVQTSIAYTRLLSAYCVQLKSEIPLPAVPTMLRSA